MGWNIQNIFFIFYVTLILLLLWFFMRKPQKIKYFKEKIKHEIKKQTQKEHNACEILGIKQGATREEIIKAYKQKIKHYHPDTVAHRGKEFEKWAKEHTLKIQKAKETLLKERGEQS